jgi:hypothetical protein
VTLTTYLPSIVESEKQPKLYLHKKAKAHCGHTTKIHIKTKLKAMRVLWRKRKDDFKISFEFVMFSFPMD